MGAGDLRQRTPIDREDEVGQLAAAFNGMVARLGETTVSKEYVDNILRSMGEALIVTGGDGRIERVNPLRGGHIRCALVGPGGASLKAVAWRAADTPIGRRLAAAGGSVHAAGKLKPRRLFDQRHRIDANTVEPCTCGGLHELRCCSIKAAQLAGRHPRRERGLARNRRQQAVTLDVGEAQARGGGRHRLAVVGQPRRRRAHGALVHGERHEHRTVGVMDLAGP